MRARIKNRGVLVATATPTGELIITKKEATNRPPFVQKPHTGRTVND